MPPPVQSTSHIDGEDVELRKTVEWILIRFSKTNAVIGREQVEC